MARVHPFRALMPSKDTVAEVAAVPYDVVNGKEASVLAEGKPLSFLHVSRSEIDCPAGVDPYSDEVYAKAAGNFAKLKEEADMRFDDEATLYIYSITAGDHRQTGIVGAVAVDDYDDDVVKKHEKTRKAKEDDRTRHTIELRAHCGPVFLLYPEKDAIDALVAPILDTPPMFEVTAEDGVRHQIWRPSNDVRDQLETEFTKLPHLYVADGHHRAKSASRAREVCKAENPNHDGSEEYNRFLAVIFPGNQLRILPYNRVVLDLNGHTSEELMAKIKESFHVTSNVSASPEDVGQIHMLLDGAWHRLVAKNVPDTGKVADTLDVAVLQDQLLAPLLGIGDPRTSNRIDFIGGIRGTQELEMLVETGKAVVAFSMYPVTVEQLIAISDGGEIMPPKSTWFEPKLRSGLLVHCF